MTPIELVRILLLGSMLSEEHIRLFLELQAIKVAINTEDGLLLWDWTVGGKGADVIHKYYGYSGVQIPEGCFDDLKDEAGKNLVVNLFVDRTVELM